jgi:DNA-binding NarL/FixJ family response regulator
MVVPGFMEAERQTSPPDPQRPRTVLVVEDNPQFAREVVRAIDVLGIGGEVIVCPTGGEALEAVGRKSASIDLALVDLGLPDIGGIEVIRAVHDRFLDTPILVISVASSEASVLEAIRAGARGYLLKGDPGAEMASSIDEVLRGNYPISPALARTLFRLAGAPADGSAGSGFDLTPRELETLQLIARGKTYKEVARAMDVSLSTVQSNVRNLYHKLEVHSQGQAVAKARGAGLV